MGADLQLDMKLLDQLGSDLDAIVTEFKGADKFSDATAADTGHDGLAGHVRDFASAWNHKRQDMTEKVENLAKSVSAITDGFTKVDSGLAQALEKGASDSAKQGVSAGSTSGGSK